MLIILVCNCPCNKQNFILVSTDLSLKTSCYASDVIVQGNTRSVFCTFFAIMDIQMHTYFIQNMCKKPLQNP